MASPSEEPSSEPTQPSPSSPATEKESVYKTKLVEFLGRTTPIVLQNDNGPCPLLAICNILLLKNNLNLSPETTEVSQEKLLSLVAERLIDSNSDMKNKEESYVENQRRNISDAIDLLPRLATGIDVNIKFRRIDDFEFTRECAIFDLLDIPLYHGWIVDPQDSETTNAIGSKSYNALMEELVALETQYEGKYVNAPEEDCVDFAAATAATLGVPSPCLSKAISFDDSRQNGRKGDLEEEAELVKALEISQEPIVSFSSEENVVKIKPVDSVDTLEKCSFEDNHTYESNEAISLEKTNEGNNLDLPVSVESEKEDREVDVGEKSNVDSAGQVESSFSLFPGKKEDISGGIDKCDNLHSSTEHVHETINEENLSDPMELPNADLKMSLELPSESEPFYEGEDRIMDPVTQDNEVGEPVYEGEAVLANQADKCASDTGSKDVISIQSGELIMNFLKSNASQLTIYGLFCLQSGLKERELCVFFRNNHFSTMFKLNNELYLLATDQGYIHQSDLVWEKLNEVNGDTLFMTGNFNEFKIENRSNDNWNEDNAMSSTAEFIASMDSAAQAGMDINPDLQLAIALQQQEFEQQQPRQNAPPQSQPSSLTGASRLITGPNVPRSNRNLPPSVRPEPKPKEKCTLM